MSAAMQSPYQSFDKRHSSTSQSPSSRPRSQRPGSAIWTQLSHPTHLADHGRLRPGFDNQPKSRSSFVDMPTSATIDLKDGPFVGKSLLVVPTKVKTTVDEATKDVTAGTDSSANGISAEYMQPSFPTLTFPNHYSMVTGLYPSSHGIVANMFYDPELKDDFNYRIPDKSWDPKWWGGEPIWEAAVRQKQRSGVIMWPGGESLRPVRPTFHVRHRPGVSALEKMEILLEWLDKPRDERPTLMNIYISEVDTEGHNYGPDGRRCQKALSEVDNALGVLLEGLRSRQLEQVVNLMVVSDHGMSYVTPDKSIYYDDYIDTSDLLLEESLQPHLGIRTEDPKKLVTLYKSLKAAQIKQNLPFQVYWREEVPARFHYSSNPRIAPLIVIADPGYVMTRRDMGLSVVGVHGWDNQMEDMRAVFAAQGPSFPNQGPEPLQAFENVELYDIMARTVGLQVKDGSTDGVRQGWVSRPC
ncbi:hypothetical protein BGZ83_005144 [Gryganskiella cystojenkinii]|nr:hypothetical protein BGZ83_005144 [Gryganskiella cystojenkinii]